MIRKLIPFLAVVLVLGGSAAAPALAAPKPPNTNVSVTKTGLQQATVTDSGGQIDCGSDCSGSYSAICGDTDIHGACIWDPGSTTLETTPPAGFRVIWGYDCEAQPSNDTNACTISQSSSVEAHFDDTTAPTVGLTAPAGGAVTSGTLPLSATASDPQTGVASVQFFVDGAPVGLPDTMAPYSLSYDTTGHADGSSVAVKARAVNADGDAAESTVNITIDNTAPELTMTGPDGTTSGPGTTQTWTYSASDATSGLSAVECSVVTAGTGPTFGACSPGAGTLSVSNQPDGHYVATIRATDAAGHTTLRSKTFSIDATDPQTSITGGPADGSSSSATTATFTFSASESGSTFECRVYPAALTPGAFGPCTGATTHTASGFSPGTYAFEVARDRRGRQRRRDAREAHLHSHLPAAGRRQHRRDERRRHRRERRRRHDDHDDHDRHHQPRDHQRHALERLQGLRQVHALQAPSPAERAGRCQGGDHLQGEEVPGQARPQALEVRQEEAAGRDEDHDPGHQARHDRQAVRDQDPGEQAPRGEDLPDLVVRRRHGRPGHGGLRQPARPAERGHLRPRDRRRPRRGGCGPLRSAPAVPELYLQRDQPPGVPPLQLTGERTLPDVPEENYWFRRHLVVYRWIASRVGGRRVVDLACGEGYGSAELGAHGGVGRRRRRQPGRLRARAPEVLRAEAAASSAT